jgi:predicted nucleic acid-binding protein
MTDPCFVDTNVLIYADDKAAGPKRETARALLRRVLAQPRTSVSIQVLQEYFAAATRRLGLPPDVARRRVAVLGRLDIVTPKLTDLLAAIDLHRLHSLSFWDALIVRAALVAGCRTLYTEDLQHGQEFDGLRVVNPFVSDQD